MNFSQNGWYPVAASDELVMRHAYQGQLWGRELALWRADDGYANVWENRCLHRGVRLSIGLNNGRELTCLYHGWRYANRTAGCTYIPAHPADAPARTVCNRTYASVEAAGLVWSCVEEEKPFALPEILANEGTSLVLRPLPVNAAPELAYEMAKNYVFAADMSDEADSELAISSDAAHAFTAGTGAQKLALFVQPIDADRAVLRGVLQGDIADESAALRYHNRLLTRLRRAIEAAANDAPKPEPIAVSFAPVEEELAEMPAASTGPKAQLRLKVARKWEAGPDIAGFELEALSGQLPSAQPGAHIDLHLPNGMVRQYSLLNAPGETDRYVVGVKREEKSRGGSECLHLSVQAGDVLAASAPRNHFPLRRDAVKTVLVGGGIGITPMISMAAALDAQMLPYDLHSFARTDSHHAFEDRLTALGDAVIRHSGLDIAATEVKLRELLASFDFAHHFYICGPAPMLEMARKIAAELGWPEQNVHFEYFANDKEIDDSSAFEVALARSAITLQVPAGKSILEVLDENGIAAPSSCGQGACGTCLATVIEGEIDHNDVYLTDAEKQAGDKIMTCVSRAKSRRLVLDI